MEIQRDNYLKQLIAARLRLSEEETRGFRFTEDAGSRVSAFFGGGRENQ